MGGLVILMLRLVVRNGGLLLVNSGGRNVGDRFLRLRLVNVLLMLLLLVLLLVLVLIVLLLLRLRLLVLVHLQRWGGDNFERTRLLLLVVGQLMLLLLLLRLSLWRLMLLVAGVRQMSGRIDETGAGESQCARQDCDELCDSGK